MAKLIGIFHVDCELSRLLLEDLGCWSVHCSSCIAASSFSSVPLSMLLHVFNNSLI